MNLSLCFLLLNIIVCTVLFVSFLKNTGETLYKYKNIVLSGGIFADVVFTVCVLKNIGFSLRVSEYEKIISAFKSSPADFAHFAIWWFAILGVLMFISNISLMKHEGMRPKNLVGTFLGVIVIGGTEIVYLISLFEEWLQTRVESVSLSKLLYCLPTFFYLLLDYCECIMVGVIIMGFIASRQKPKYNKDFIIIPGCCISKTGGLLPLIKGRTNTAVKYAWEQEIASGKKLMFIPSGGQGADEIMSEGSAMELYLLSHGSEPYEVFAEKESLNTEQNIEFSYNIAKKHKENPEIAFSTTNYHVLRCGMIARNLGIDAEGIASKTKWYFWPNGFAREVVAIFKMSLKYHIGMALLFCLFCVVCAIFI